MCFCLSDRKMWTLAQFMSSLHATHPPLRPVSLVYCCPHMVSKDHYKATTFLLMQCFSCGSEVVIVWHLTPGKININMNVDLYADLSRQPPPHLKTVKMTSSFIPDGSSSIIYGTVWRPTCTFSKIEKIGRAHV